METLVARQVGIRKSLREWIIFVRKYPPICDLKNQSFCEADLAEAGEGV